MNNKIIRVLIPGLVGLSFICLVGLILRLIGFDYSFVLSGSMEPTINTNAVIITYKTPFEEIGIGDIVATETDENTKLVVHRITDSKIINNAKYFITKGDNNDFIDIWGTTEETYKMKVVSYINFIAPILTLIFARLTSFKIRLLKVVISILLVFIIGLFAEKRFWGYLNKNVKGVINMKPNILENDVYMTTEHTKGVKAKVSFKAVLNKMLVSTLIFTSVTGGIVAPMQVSAANNTYKIGATIDYYANSNIENILYDITQVIQALEDMIAAKLVTNEILINLSTQLSSLNNAVLESGASASSEVVKTVLNAENTVTKVKVTTQNEDGLTKIKANVALIKSNLGIISTEQSIKNQELLSTKSKYPTTFTDITSKTTNYKYINYLANKGVIGGYKDGTFKPSTKMSNSKFIGMLVRTVNPKSSRATKGNDYNKALMDEAIAMGILKKYELSKDDYNKAMTKADMALWVARALDYLNADVKEIKRIENLIADYSTVEGLGTKYEDAMKIVVSKGILSLDKNNKSNPKSSISRSNAAVVLARVVEVKYRKDMSKVVIPMHETNDREARILKWRDKNRPLPKAGDTFIDKNGKKTVLTSIWVDGKEIIGYGQNVQDLYGNMMNGLKVGELGGSVDGDNRYLGSPYLIDEKTGVGYFRVDWLTIATYEDGLTYKVKNPKEGQVVGTWTKYYKQYGWVFMGPM